ncbi:hypothetical protein LguiB_021434 [Lonicera macranthoides]
MASTLKNTMKEQQNPKLSKALIATKNEQNLPSKSPLPHNLSTKSQQKRGISIHKLLVNTMQRKNHHQSKHNKETENSIPFKEKKSKKKKRKNKKWAKPKTLLPKKVGSILCNVFGRKKSEKGICSATINDVKRPNFWSPSLKEILEMENQEELDNRKKLKEKSILSLSFSDFFRKKSSNRSNSDQVGAKLLMGKQENGSKLARNPSGNRKIRRGRSMRKKVVKQSKERENEEVERQEDELCKKRILKGVKCRPLNLSGDLHYDRNGVLLPEEVIP